MKKVYLIGAGPGDKDLITVRGKKLIESADVIIYDNLANPELLSYKKEHCICFYVGKKAGQHTLTQDKINELIVEQAKKHSCVVRLKGGDPYVFGRGREEGEALKNAGIAFEVVPGITSAIGGLCYAGIPITSRNIATSFHVITGHISEKSTPIDFEQLSKVNGTLVFLMGVKNLPVIVKQLMHHGKSPDTPVAIIYKATTPDQKVYTSTLENITEMAKNEAVKPPSLIVVGEVVQHRETLNFFEERMMFGKHVLVTRSRSRHSKMTDLFLEEGAKVTVMPAIQTVAKNQERLVEYIENIHAYQGLVFTSGVAVELFFKALETMKTDVRCLFGIKILVVGNETKKVLKKYGILADLIPETFTNDGVIKTIRASFHKDDHLLIPRSAKGDPALIQQIEEICHGDEVHVYDTELVEEVFDDVDDVDYVTFTSSSTVHGLMHQMTLNPKLKDIVKQAKLVAIGPVTAETLRSYGYKVDLQPKTYTIFDMVETIKDDLRKDPS